MNDYTDEKINPMEFLKKIFRKVRILRKIRIIFIKLRNKAQEGNNYQYDDKPPYSHCLNCGEELRGGFCHKCGQQASLATGEMSVFIKEYFKTMLAFDRQVVPTLRYMLFIPGRLTKEFYSGRHKSYLHPLKLNFFLLILLITMFSLFGSDSKVINAVHDMAEKDLFTSESVLSTIVEDTTLARKMQESVRDTITLVAPYSVVKDYKQVMDLLNVKSLYKGDTDDESDTLLVVVPSLMLKDDFIVEKNGHYHFSCEGEHMESLMLLSSLSSGWAKATSFFIAHFPLLMLLTAPLMAMATRLTLKKIKKTRTYCYIFSLYYMAFVELLLVLLYLTGIIFDYSFESVRGLLLTILFLYLTMAVKQAFDLSSWIKSAFAATFINVLYVSLCFFIISIVSLVAIVVFVSQIMSEGKLYV